MADKRISQLADRGTVANNDVVAIVVSGAVTTNKATISSIQTFMQGNLDLGVTSVGITLGSSGTDVSVTGSPITTSGNITINIPDASTSARGVVTTGAQNFAGNKSFQNTIFANAGVRLDQNGTALQTFIQNSSGTGLITTNANGVGFNNSNNFFFAGSNKGCAVFEVNNTAVRNYTLQNADGTLAFTSDLTGFVTLGTAQTITAQKTFTGSGGSDTMIISHGSGSGFALDVIKAGNGDVIRVLKTSGSGNAMTVQGGNFEAPTIVKTGGTSSQFLKADGSVDSSTYLTTGSANSTFVPYSGATGSVNLGVYNIAANAINSTGSGSIAGQINLRSDTVNSLLNGYGSITSNTSNAFIFYQTTAAGVFRGAILSLNSITASATRTYTLPDADGTIALTSGLAAYLPLAGGTLTGALNGTSAGFTGVVSVSATPSSWVIFKPIQLGLGAFLAGRDDDTSQVWLGANAYYDGGTNFEYKANGFATNYHQSGGSHNFQIAASGTLGNNITFTNALTLASTGAATFSSTVETTGIKFPATQVASADANTLDDYEEGAWTPVVKIGSTTNSSVTSTGKYTKIGNVVYIQATIESITKSGSGGLTIQGLPFTIGTSTTFGFVQGTLRWDDIASAGIIYPYFEVGTTIIVMQDFSNTGYVNDIQSSQISSTYQLYGISGFYMV